MSLIVITYVFEIWLINASGINSRLRYILFYIVKICKEFSLYRSNYNYSGNINKIQFSVVSTNEKLSCFTTMNIQLNNALHAAIVHLYVTLYHSKDTLGSFIIHKNCLRYFSIKSKFIWILYLYEATRTT